MDLPSDGLKLQAVELLVRDDERKSRVRRRRDSSLHRASGLSADDLAGAVEDAAVRVHDDEREDLRRSGLAVRAALPGELGTGPVARRRRASRAACAQREPPRPHRADGGTPKLLVGIDRIRAPAVIEEDRAGHERDVRPLR